MPKHDPARHQRWYWREIRQVLRYLGYVTGKQPVTKQQEVALAFLISLRTAMRAGEVLQVSSKTLSGRVVTLPTTKTEKRAQVPLTKQGARLCGMVKGWTINSASLDALFRKARDNCLIADLRFHDARATALTILAKRVDVLVLSRISRHKNLKMLSEVYFRKTASEIAAGL
jgi:integrase